MSRLRLKIGPVVLNAEEVKRRVEQELPQHTGLISLAAGVATAARDAEHVAQRLRRPFGLHRLPAAFLALTGLEMMAYRKRFHELNSLVSLISIHQSSKDVLGVTDPQTRRNHLLYLSLCSDLLGLVSMIGGYYTQENSSLLFSGLPEIIHQRCDGLKINIQLKILHATINTGPIESAGVGSVVATPPV